MKERRATLLLGGLRREPIRCEHAFAYQKSVVRGLLWTFDYSLAGRNSHLNTPKLSPSLSLSGLVFH